MKGIILAGGTGTRLYPITKIINKQLIPIYDKPMVYYPLSILMLAGIKEVLIITTEKDIDTFKELLGDGSQYGINIVYEIQYKPNGLAEAFIIGEEFIGDDSVCMILGDNVFYGQGFVELLQKAAKLTTGAVTFCYQVKDATSFGVVEFDKNKKVLSIEEKPKVPKSNWAMTGIYFYDNTVVAKAKLVTPSNRGELEIGSINLAYLAEETLAVETLGRGFTWLDTGTHENLLKASEFVKIMEDRQGYKISCLEEIAYRYNFITAEALELLAELPENRNNKEYLLGLLNE